MVTTRTERKLQGLILSVGVGGWVGTRQNYRVFPYQLGCMVRLSSTGTSVSVTGTGDFKANDYFIVCRQVFYGNSYYWVPDTTRVGKCLSITSGSATGTMTIATALVLERDEYLLNLGADSGGYSPVYDGSRIVLYSDCTNQTAINGHYVLTGQGGIYQCWIGDAPADASDNVVDLLVKDESDNLVMVIPFVTLGDQVT